MSETFGSYTVDENGNAHRETDFTQQSVKKNR